MVYERSIGVKMKSRPARGSDSDLLRPEEKVGWMKIPTKHAVASSNMYEGVWSYMKLYEILCEFPRNTLESSNMHN